ncbi:MAG TPA: lasso peptide biosynthesis B2 protein [Candidatus Acidoferrales bacterium]|nr:lasso peptide biosynthesis B2 protein [Candidatus Acidoferrales bacterium]
MNSSWEKYRRLSSGERRDLVRGFVLIPWAVAFVNLFGVKPWKRAAPENAALNNIAGKAESEQLNEARTAAGMIEAASRNGIVRGNCLSKSVALWWLLRHKSIDAELQIGARKAGGGLEAHAWVELNGKILNDADDVRESFAAFDGPMTSRAAARK